jgi:hypothetical protein
MAALVAAGLGLLVAGPSFAWGPEGHQLVGQVADGLLNAHARAQVKQILGYDLKTAATWPDCVRSVERSADGTFHYNSHTPYQKPCDGFMAPAEVARMEDYVRRNWSTCSYEPGHGCHESYHFADIAVQRGAYSRHYFGSNDHDVVSAIDAAVAVLQDRPAPAPFSIKDKKEALFLLAHFVGDMHQPLHVGAVYLSPTGTLVDPDKPGTDKVNSATHGGNLIELGGKNLHSEWDETPAKWSDTLRSTVIANGGKVTHFTGQVDVEAALWASETVATSKKAFDGLTFSGASPGKWKATAADPSGYDKKMSQIAQDQVAKGGARLAHMLNVIWP